MSPKMTDEGTTFPVDVGLGEAVSLPRIKEKPYTLCQDDQSDKSAPHPTDLPKQIVHLPPGGEGFKSSRFTAKVKRKILFLMLFQTDITIRTSLRPAVDEGWTKPTFQKAEWMQRPVA